MTKGKGAYAFVDARLTACLLDRLVNRAWVEVMAMFFAGIRIFPPRRARKIYLFTHPQ